MTDTQASSSPNRSQMNQVRQAEYTIGSDGNPPPAGSPEAIRNDGPRKHQKFPIRSC